MWPRNPHTIEMWPYCLALKCTVSHSSHTQPPTTNFHMRLTRIDNCATWGRTCGAINHTCIFQKMWSSLKANRVLYIVRNKEWGSLETPFSRNNLQSLVFLISQVEGPMDTYHDQVLVFPFLWFYCHNFMVSIPHKEIRRWDNGCWRIKSNCMVIPLMKAGRIDCMNSILYFYLEVNGSKRTRL